MLFPRDSSKSVMTIPTASLDLGVLYVSPVLSVSMACRDLLGLCIGGLGLVLGISRPVCTKHPDIKAGQELDTDKPGCITSDRVGDTNAISPLVCGFSSHTLDFCSQP